MGAQREEQQIRDMIATDTRRGIEELTRATHIDGLWYVSAEGRNCQETCHVRGLTCDEEKMINKSNEPTTPAKLGEVFSWLGNPCQDITMQNNMAPEDILYLPARRIDGAWCEGTAIIRNRIPNTMVCPQIPPAGASGFEQRLCYCILKTDVSPPIQDYDEQAREVSHEIEKRMMSGSSVNNAEEEEDLKI